MDAWVYERAADLELSAAERMRRFPRDADMTACALRGTVQMAMRAFLRIYNRFDVVGRENLPAGESFVMVCNHSSHFDALCLLSSLPLRRVHRAFPAAAADYFFSSPLRSAFSIIVVNGLPFDRQHHGAASLDVCRQLLSGPNNVLIMFPEGTRSCSGTLGRFRSGVARVVAGTTTPVVPCYLSGAYGAWPKGRVRAAPGRSPSSHRPVPDLPGRIACRSRGRGRHFEATAGRRRCPRVGWRPIVMVMPPTLEVLTPQNLHNQVFWVKTVPASRGVIRRVT